MFAEIVEDLGQVDTILPGRKAGRGEVDTNGPRMIRRWMRTPNDLLLRLLVAPSNYGQWWYRHRSVPLGENPLQAAGLQILEDYLLTLCTDESQKDETSLKIIFNIKIDK